MTTEVPYERKLLILNPHKISMACYPACYLFVIPHEELKKGYDLYQTYLAEYQKWEEAWKKRRFNSKKSLQNFNCFSRGKKKSLLLAYYRELDAWDQHLYGLYMREMGSTWYSDTKFILNFPK